MPSSHSGTTNGQCSRDTLVPVSRGAKTPKSETQKSRAHEKNALGSKPSGKNIEAPQKRAYRPAADGPAIPDASAILAGETFRSRKPSEWKVKPNRRKH